MRVSARHQATRLLSRVSERVPTLGRRTRRSSDPKARPAVTTRRRLLLYQSTSLEACYVHGWRGSRALRFDEDLGSRSRLGFGEACVRLTGRGRRPCYACAIAHGGLVDCIARAPRLLSGTYGEDE
jgi:hypothetical protein